MVSQITFEPKSTPQSYITGNIEQKNLLMEPFYSGDAIRQLGVATFEHVLFIEDSVFCAEDVLEVKRSSMSFNNSADLFFFV